MPSAAKKRLLTLLLLASSATEAAAFTGAPDPDEAGLALTGSPRPEITLSVLGLPNKGAGLADSAGASLVGAYGVNAAFALAQLAPNLAGCKSKLAQSQGTGRAVHEYYDLYFGDYPLLRASLHLHHYDNRLVLLHAELPDYHLPALPFTAEDFLPLAALGLDAAGATQQQARAVIAEANGAPAPAWEVTRFDPVLGRSRQLLIDAQSGTVLASETLSFNIAEVYAQSPADGVLTAVTLPDLPSTGYLDGKHFVVYAPTATDPRAQAPDGHFDFHPDDPTEALAFDQVQTYYGATRALAWFQTKVGFDIGATQLTVSVNTLVNGVAANAAYVPAPVGPMILIGKGDATLTNLARDSAVISHEFSHHIIFQHLKGRTGESGVLHEGTADYFAYAINGDPCLGESIIPGGRCLRTALLPTGARYDQVPSGTDIHLLGQYWSAVLWDLRGQLGDPMDRLVYDALAYLSANSGLTDAFLGLVNADRDQFPLATGAAGGGAYGQHLCQILNAAVERGFAQALSGLDGSSCGLNLGDLAQQSRAISYQVQLGDKGDNRKGASITILGHTCAVVLGAGGEQEQHRQALAALGLLLVPLIGAALRARGVPGVERRTEWI